MGENGRRTDFADGGVFFDLRLEDREDIMIDGAVDGGV